MLDLTNTNYVPNMVIRTSERAAIMNIPHATASQILPVLTIVPVGKSGDAVLKRIKDMQGEMWPTIPVEIGEAIEPKPGESPNNVHIFLRSLRDRSSGFQNWQDFIEANSNLIPTLLIPKDTHESSEIIPQIDRFSGLGRGIVFKVKRRHVEANPAILDVYHSIIREIIRRGIQSEVLVVLDYGKIGNSETTQNWCTTTFEHIFHDNDPRNFRVSLAGTNFPDGFNGLYDEIRRVEIYERTLFENFLTQNKIGRAHV